MTILHSIKKWIPDWLLNIGRPIYHYLLAVLGAIIYRFPTTEIKVIGVTGTKGKTSTTEIINAIFEEAGYSTALSNTVRFKIDDDSRRNKKKMTMPGRFFLQRFFRNAVNEGCDYVILEMTSQGVLQHRHRFIYLDVFAFTNISPEHIESHGSFKNYLNAKLKLADLLERSPKNHRVAVANIDNQYGDRFLDVDVEEKRPYSLTEAAPYTVDENEIEFERRGEKLHSPLGGKFNLYNILASIEVAESQGVKLDVIKSALDSFGGIPGRLEKIRLSSDVDEEIRSRQDFPVIVDYAHTPESLESVYKVFEGKQKVCVLGNAGGGRDTWKRKKMAKIAENYCEEIVLTNEDPYDEDPKEIVDEMARAISIPKYNIVMDRRKAIRNALQKAVHMNENGRDVAVLITGKGTDPYIMEAGGTKTPWDDRAVTREELEKVLKEGG